MQLDKSLVLVMGLFFGVTEANMNIKFTGTTLILNCNENKNVTIKRINDLHGRETASSQLTIQEVSDADTALYSCTDDLSNPTLIFIKACQNCVRVDSGTMTGIVIGDLITTILIAVAVYCISIPAKGKIYQGFDRRALIQNDDTGTLYSGLKQKDRQEYSRLKLQNKQ
ncbi:TYRO protein tyrosine kinase-binding protein isoform X2 [Narcine bancroftii]|uniref:TYRO protein tyrosine kinase-binding protein isoform X2 n=1 Tax=Narcine bancroftii TaxID=1343680 RepID=UPI003831A5D2